MPIKVNPKTMMIQADYWVPPICLKQLEVLDAFEKMLLVTGPKLSGKTQAILHKICRHAFDFPGSRIAIVTKSLKTGKIAGVWADLTTRILPIWQAANIGFDITLEPKVTGDTRQNMFKIRSRFGAESEVYLHSLEYAPEVDQKLKGTEYSLIWFSEIDQIAPEPEHIIAFNTACDQLRLNTVPYEFRQVIMDCNPPDSGPKHWLYEKFWREKERPDHPNPRYQSQLRRIEFSIEDNPFLDPRQVEDLKSQYSFRQSLYNRFILGLWEEDLLGGHFTEMFREEDHVRGDVAKQEGLVPSSGVKLLITGFDPGDKNNAWIVMEKCETPGDDALSIKPVFSVIDELVTIDKALPLRDFVEAQVEMILKWENFCKETYNRTIRWRHYSDTSAWRFKSAAEAHEAMLVYNLSGGKIELIAAPKYKGSLRDRVRLIQELLYEKRLLLSAHLRHAITMMKVLRKGESAAEYVTPKEHTHIFSALSYALQSEVPVDERIYSNVTTGKAPPKLVVV